MRATILPLVFLGLVSAQSFAQENFVDKHVKVYYEPGRFGGWPANHGIWIWGNEILVGFGRGYYKDLGPEKHNIDRDKPEEHVLARSLDGGETWTLEHPNDKGFLLPQGKEGLHGTELPGVPLKPSVYCPGDIDFTHPDFAMALRMTSVHAGSSNFYYSYDRGKVWEGPFFVPSFGIEGTAARTDYIVDGKRSCTVFLTAPKASGEEGRPFCMRTRDGGTAWEFLSWIGEEMEGFAIMPSSVRISDTELITAIRCQTETRKRIALYVSNDNGYSWTYLNDPVADTGKGNPASMIKLADGRICITYGVRAVPYRMCAKLSSDNGRTWGPEITLRNDGSGRDLGYPRTVQRPDGKVVTVYYFMDAQTGPERYIGATIWDPAKM
ncbi:MAG: sialidase family protein [FCB group bacterium]|jgi:hypothetical protein|nr:sialidase family protein [FCB group bacterium]